MRLKVLTSAPLPCSPSPPPAPPPSPRPIGKVLLRHRAAALPALARLMKGRIIARGFIKRAELIEKDGFSLGHIAIRTDQGRQLIVPVLNEYMMALDGGR